MKRVGKGEISMKRAWQIQKGGRRRTRRSNPGKRKRSVRNTARRRGRKRGRKKKSWKRKVSVAAQTALAFFPEIRTVATILETQNYAAFPDEWVFNRTGYYPSTGHFDITRAVANNAISIGGPLLIRAAMKGVK